MVPQVGGLRDSFSQLGGREGLRPASENPGAPAGREPRDRVSISDRARRKSQEKPGALKTEKDLDPEAKQQVNQLKKRDAEVKAHEAAHMSAGGTVVQGGASYQYERGPDGKMYAVGGEVKIDMSPENSPEATIRKMQQVKQAALAPAQPSGTDRAVAARAAQIEAKARSEKAQALEKPVGADDVDGNTGMPPSDAKGPSADPAMEPYDADLAPIRSNSAHALGRIVNFNI